MWHLTKLALHNRLVTLGIVALLVGLSIWALLGLQQELIPDIELPYMTVVTVFPQAPADRVAGEVSAPIEQMIWQRYEGRGLKHVYSTSVESMSMGISLVMAEFQFGTGMGPVVESISEGIAEMELPPEVRGATQVVPDLEENPTVTLINVTEVMPLVVFSLSGDVTAEQLRAVADSEIVPALSEIEGVLKVETEGGSNDRVIITLDPAKMNQFGLSAAMITGALPAEIQAPAREALLARVEGIPLGTDDAVLGSVAEVDMGPTSAIVRTNREPSLTINVWQDKGSNTVDAANAVVGRAYEVAGDLDGLTLTTVMDQSEFIEKSINSLVEKALIGGALAVVVVFVFLMAVRASLVTAISIPISMLLGFGAMYLFKITINVLTLSAMSIAVGRLIDDSIVIVEVIYRRLQGGEPFREAAIGGAREVATPITAATLATVAIFLPLAFVGGIVGELFVPFALTVTFAMLASLLVALMVVPTLSNFLVGGKTRSKVRDSWYERAYTPVLKWALGHRAITLVAVTALFLGSLGLAAVVGTSFMSGMSRESLTVEVRLPPGTSIGQTSDVAAGVEGFLAGYEEVEMFYTTVGTSATTMSGALSAASGGGSNTARITAYLKSGADPDRAAQALRADCRGLPGGESIVVSTSVGSDMGFSGVEISIQGDDPEAIAATANELFAGLREVKGVANLTCDLSTVVPRLTIQPDPAKMAALGLSAEQRQRLTQEYYLLMAGGDLPGHQARIDGSSYGLHMTSVTPRLTGVEQASALRIGWPPVPLASVADVDLVPVPTHISHTDLKRSGTITGAITAKDVGSVNAAIEKQISGLSPHEGVQVKITGITEMMNETLGRMSIAIVAATFISFLVVAITLRSVLNPLIIMVSLPLATIGAFLGLLLGGYSLGVSGMMGMLMLVGIVLTNAIVLIAVVEQLRQEGLSTHDALVQGGRIRLRPILMTALTTIFAMVPLALGVESGTMIAGELAVVVIGGLFSSTLLTLVVIPVLYSLTDRLRRRPAPAKAAAEPSGPAGPAGP